MSLPGVEERSIVSDDTVRLGTRKKRCRERQEHKGGRESLAVCLGPHCSSGGVCSVGEPITASFLFPASQGAQSSSASREMAV